MPPEPCCDGVCDGRCCAVFHFTSSLEEIEAKDPEKYPDRGFLLDMLEPLTERETHERINRFGIEGESAQHVLGRTFTCRHWDEDTRLCTVYEDRPKMCRDYPYAGTCQHGCGFVLEDEELREGYRKRRCNVDAA